MAKRKSRQPERPVGEEPRALPPATDGRVVARSNPPPPYSAPDYYAILGVDPDASHQTIALAYRRKAAECSRRLGSETVARELKLLNAAYLVVGNQARRADYDCLNGFDRGWRAADGSARADGDGWTGRPDGRPSAPWGDGLTGSELQAPARGEAPDRPMILSAPRSGVSSSRPGLPRWKAGGRFELFALAVIAAVALGAGAVVIGLAAPITLGPAISEAAYILGIAPSPRAVEVEPERTFEILPEMVVPVEPTPEPTALPLEAQFEGTSVVVEPSDPRQSTEVTVVTSVVRQGEPVVGLPLHAIVRFRTVNERWPRGDATVRTDERGVGRISFNIGNATRGHTVRVEVFAEVEDQQMVWHGAFTPP